MAELQWNDIVRPPTTASQARLELAAVCRLAARENIAPIGASRFATRDPERPGTYLINSGGLLLVEVCASNLIAVDRDGVRLDDGIAEPDAGALALVLASLEAKPEAVAAAQVATTAGCAVASLKDGLLPITQTSFMFHGALGTYDWEAMAAADTLRQGIAAEMNNCSAVLVRGRGLLVAGDTLAQAWKFLFFLNKCCRSQIDAMAAAKGAGASLTMPTKAVIDHAVAQSRAFIEHPRYVADWPSALEQLDREDPSYRD